jgi:hypothetical protein
MMKKLLFIFLLSSCTQLAHFNIIDCEIEAYIANTITPGIDAKIDYVYSGKEPIELKLFVVSDKKVLDSKTYYVGYNTLITYRYNGYVALNSYICAVWTDGSGKHIRQFDIKKKPPIYE